jgi:membrane protein DedA with SNARE-associated domain
MSQNASLCEGDMFVLANLTSTLISWITNLYVVTGLLGIAVAMAIESCCIPLPSEIVMPLAGIMISQHKILNGVNPILSLVLVALAGSIGGVIGSIVAYWIGYKGGRPLMLRYGRYLLISQHDADKADAFFQRWGSATAFFSRLLPVVRTYISLPAGITKMPFGKFCLYSFLGSLPWCLLLAYLGTLIGDNLDKLSPIFHSLDIVILVLLVALVVLYVWRHLRNDRKAREELAALEQAKQAAPQQQNAQQSWGQVPSSAPQAQWQNTQQNFPARQEVQQSQQPLPPSNR